MVYTGTDWQKPNLDDHANKMFKYPTTQLPGTGMQISVKLTDDKSRLLALIFLMETIHPLLVEYVPPLYNLRCIGKYHS